MSIDDLKTKYDEKSCVITRNILIAEELKKRYEYYSIRCWYSGTLAKLYLNPHNYWIKPIIAATLFYNLYNDKIFCCIKSDYSVNHVFVAKKIFDAPDLYDTDRVIVAVKNGAYYERYSADVKTVRANLNLPESRSGIVAINKNVFQKANFKYRKAFQ